MPSAAKSSPDRVSQFPGLSPRGRAVLAYLEHTRMWPRQAEQALRYWQLYLRDPCHGRWDRPDSCGEWYCCPDLGEVRRVLEIVAHNLPPRDARRFRSMLAAIGDDPP
jgi:hypothetical protein